LKDHESAASPAPPHEATALLGDTPQLLQGGDSPVWRGAAGIVRVAEARILHRHVANVQTFRRTLPKLARLAPDLLEHRTLADGRALLLEQDLGAVSADPMPLVETLVQASLAQRAEPELVTGSLRRLLSELPPAAKPRVAPLLRALRAAARQGAALPFRPRQAVLDRGLDRSMELSFLRTASHGALLPRRVLASGACHWSRFSLDGRASADLAPFCAPDPQDPALSLHVLKWAWRRDPLRAADALVALGLVDPDTKAQVQLELVSAHPCLDPPAIRRILGCDPGPVSPSAAARALARGQGLVVAGQPIRLRSDPAVPARRGAGTWRIRDRDPRRLFSRWHEGIRLDPDARASLTPEHAALDMARRLRAETVLDGFCGAGGNAIALARMPWCRRVVALDSDPRRLDMARHNAAIYGVQQRIEFRQGDFFEIAPGLDPLQACFLDPPWAAGADMAHRAWELARRHFPRGALKLPRQRCPPSDARLLEPVFGVGPIVSFLLAWWG